MNPTNALSVSAAPRSPEDAIACDSRRITGEKIFSPLVQQFLDYLKLEKHFSDYTVKSYGADLIQFGQFLCGEIGPMAGKAEPAAADSLDGKQLACDTLAIRDFLNYLYGQNYTKSTTARK